MKLITMQKNQSNIVINMSARMPFQSMDDRIPFMVLFFHYIFTYNILNLIAHIPINI